MRIRGATAAMILAVTLTACDDDGSDSGDGAQSTSEAPGAAETGPSTAGQGDASADTAAIEDTVQGIIAATQEKDSEAFLALVTDQGLEGFDWGTREEITAGGGAFGEDDLSGLTIAETTVEGDTAAAVVDLAAGVGIVRLSLPLVREEGTWKVDGLEFLGSPPPRPGQEVVEIDAGDYAFTFDRTATSSGDFAIRFVNSGTEAHEMTMFRAPADVPLVDAAAALSDVDGGALDNVPPPFELVDHLTFAEPGRTVDFQFAEPLAPGHYIIACYIPQGTVSEDELEQAPVDAMAHIKLGMIADFTVDG